MIWRYTVYNLGNAVYIGIWMFPPHSPPAYSTDVERPHRITRWSPKRAQRLGSFQEVHPFFSMVGGLEHVLLFHSYWECHHPNWRTHIFQRGGEKPPTRLYSYVDFAECPARLPLRWLLCGHLPNPWELSSIAQQGCYRHSWVFLWNNFKNAGFAMYLFK